MSSDTIPPLLSPSEDELDSISPSSLGSPVGPAPGTMQLLGRELDAGLDQLPQLPPSVDEEESQSHDGSFHTHDEGGTGRESESLGSGEESYKSAEEEASDDDTEEGSVVYASTATQTSQALQPDTRRPAFPRPRPRPAPENDPRPVEFRRLHGAPPAIDLA